MLYKHPAKRENRAKPAGFWEDSKNFHEIFNRRRYREVPGCRQKSCRCTEQRQPNLPTTVTDSQSEPQFAALVMPEAVWEKASAHRSTLVQSTPAIRIKIGETEIEVPEGIESKHLKMVLKAVQNAR